LLIYIANITDHVTGLETNHLKATRYSITSIATRVVIPIVLRIIKTNYKCVEIVYFSELLLH